METKEQLAKKQAFEFKTDYKPWIEDLPYKDYAEEGYYQGFLAGYEASQPKWISIDEQLPKLDEKVLLKVNHQNLGEIVVQGCYRDEAQYITNYYIEEAEKNKESRFGKFLDVEFWREKGTKPWWVDYSGKKLGLTIKNKVVAWMPIPQ